MTRCWTGSLLFRYTAVCFAVVLIALTAQAQITNVTGDQAPPIEGAGHNYIKMLNETVNPATGSVSIRINVPVPPSRGVTVPFAFAYDSKAALHFSPQGEWISGNPFASAVDFISRAGWSYLLPYMSVGSNVIASQNGQSLCQYFTDYTFTDLRGASHGLYVSAVQPLNGDSCTTYYGAPNNNLVNQPYGADAQVQTNISGTANFEYMPPTSVADMDGTVYSFAASTTPYYFASLFPTTIEDRNGNIATLTASGPSPLSVTVTDDVGRTSLSISGFGSTGNTVTVPGPSTYTLTWGTYSNSSSFPWVGKMTQSNACSLSVPYGGDTGPSSSRISAISLPNGKSYQFQYDPVTGLLSKLIYPSGGYVRYVWGMTSTVFDSVSWEGEYQGGWSPCTATYEDFVLQNRYVSFDGVHEVEEQDFAYVTTMPGWVWTQRQNTVTTKDLVRGTQFNTIYTYVPMSVPTQPNDWNITSTTPVESEVQYSDTNGSLLRTVQKNYVDPHLPPDETITLDNNQESYTHNAYISMWPSGESSPACVGSGSSLCLAVLSNKYQYDFGTGAHGPLLRQTHYDYASFVDTPIFSTEPSILDRPSDVITYDGSSNKMAETDYAYDQTSVSAVSATGHDNTNYPSGSGVPRGNVTTETVKCLQTGCPNAVTKYSYDETGQIISKIDPCGNGTCSDMNGTTHTTTYSYTDSYSVLSGGVNKPYTPSGNTNAYLTQITDPLSHTANFTYDFTNGQLTVAKDENGQGTTYIYNDPLARPTQSNYPDGGQTEATYNDVAPSPSVTTCQLISGTAGAACSSTSPPTGWKTTLSSMDGLGHVVQTEFISDPDGATFTAASYDGMGKTYQTWNPTRCSPPTTNCGTETTWGYTTYLYDAIGRTEQVTKPDGSVATTSYSGSSTTVTDEVGNQRTRQTDGLGRLIGAWEAPNNSGYNFETDYAYDPLNNLLGVNQKGGSSNSANWRARSFVYDSLSRLTSASNPESGTITYQYDLNGNLSSKVAPRPDQTGPLTVTTNYSYDVLNRLTQKSYSGLSTPTVKYAYDGSSLTSCGQNPPTITFTNPIGRRTAMCGGESGSSWSYDSTGRVLLDSRINAGGGNQTKYSVGSTYYLDGSLKTLTYPSGDVFTYTVGGAGRAIQLSDPNNNFVGYSGKPATYAPEGSLASMANGYTSTFSGILTSNIYNNRLQPMLLSASVGTNPIFSLCYDFHLGVAINSAPCQFSKYTSGDNGNVYQVLNNIDSTRNAVYAYDPLNRIAQANTINTSGANCWGEVYTIDPWGNLYNRAGVSGMGTCYTEGLSATATTQNQLSGIGVLYDAAGNVTNDGLGNQPTYDAENRIATDAGVTYYYDADGLRMEKSTGTKYWFGTDDEVLTEASLPGTINEEYVYFNGARIARVDRPSGTVHYYLSDDLGSASVITDASGNVQETNYYYPYGGLVSSAGSDPNHYKFTGKERDSESSLDNFGARYFASTVGRFMTPDWAARPTAVPYALFGDPQSLNLYTYVRNDPVSDADADGHSASGEPAGCGLVGEPDCYAEPHSSESDPRGTSLEQSSKSSVSVVVTAPMPPPVPTVPFPLWEKTLEELGRIAGVGVRVVRNAALPVIIMEYVISPPNKFACDATDQPGCGVKAASDGKEATPATKPDQFEPVRGTSAKKDKTTGEIWAKDKSRHGGDHYEVYKNKREYDKGNRDRQVWSDGTTGRRY